MSDPTSPTGHDRPQRPLTILVADDEPMIVRSLKKFFTMRGHDVRTASDAEAALLLVDAHTFDAALVDARMPGGGLTVIERLEGDPRFGGKVVLMTGAPASDPLVKVGPGVIRLQKPFSLAELVPVVEGDVRH